MADKPPADPLATWRELVAQWEKSVNSYANSTMASDQFSAPMNQMLSATLRAQQSLGDAMARYLAALNLPSRNDLSALGEQLGAIEERLAQIASLLERQAGTHAPANVAMPPRTKRPSAKNP